LLLVSEVDAALGVTDALDSHIGPVKQRRRGLSGGGLVMSFVEMMLAGGDFMSDLEGLRADAAGAKLRTVAEAPAPTTAGELARRFDDEHVGGIEAANAEVLQRAVAAMPEHTGQRLERTPPTIHFDFTDVQVYGLDKEEVGWNYEGRRCGRPCPAVWAEAGVPLAAELTGGDDDPCPVTPGLIGRAVAGLPAGLAPPRVRADAGLFSRHVAHAARRPARGSRSPPSATPPSGAPSTPRPNVPGSPPRAWTMPRSPRCATRRRAGRVAPARSCGACR